IEMGSADGLDRAGFERMVTDELRARFVVKGVDPKLEWQEDAGVRYLAQSLMEQGSAYAVSDKFLVLASSREFARDILQAGSAAPRTSPTSIDGPVEYYARVRIAAAGTVFDRLMKKLDGSAETNADSDKESEREVKFFSENIAGLITATAFKEMNVIRTSTLGATTET